MLHDSTPNIRFECLQFLQYTTENGLPSNVIYGILEDAYGRLWISTNQGLSCLNPESGKFRNFTIMDGLQGNQFNAGAYCRKDNGYMLFGGVNGITSFRPETLIDNPYAPKPVINKLFVHNKEVLPDDETGIPEVYDNQKVIVGGMITDKTIKYTKNNKVMAFLTVEDLVGTVEVVVFPRDYEKCQMFLNEDARLFIQGRVSAEDDKASKLILEKVRTFDDMPKELWIQFESREDYAKAETGLVDDLMSSRGNSSVVIYLKDVKAMKKLPPAYQVHIEDSWLEHMCEKYGSSNVKIVDRVLKNL